MKYESEIAAEVVRTGQPVADPDRMMVCDACHGLGAEKHYRFRQAPLYTTCWTCDGTGWMPKPSRPAPGLKAAA